ncbi:uncharacterized protein [Littorina saxatilis]|uniref:EGF-like domain-containing protein n=1 Tax=Littorina saxatilis TaxID=31220 RepID=A0AAN9B0B6_9CAEN
MYQGHERTIVFPTWSIFVMLIAVQTVSAKTCDELHCLNSNPCQSSIAHDNTTHARCICSGKWAGPRCEHLIRLEPETVTSSQAKLKVDLMTPQSYDVPATSGVSSALSLVSVKVEASMTLNYTLVFWRRNDTITSLTSDSSFLTSGDISCVLLHKHSLRPILEGLLPRTRYTICVENGFVDSCVLSSFTDSSAVPFPPSSHVTSFQSGLTSSWPSNCVTIFTPNRSLSTIDTTKSSTVTAVAVASVFVLAVLIIVFVTFLLRRQSVSVRLCVDAVFCGWYCCACKCCKSESSCNNSVDTAHLNHSFSQTNRTVFSEEGLPREKRTRKRQILQRLRCNKKKQKSSSYTTANMLLPPPPVSSLSFPIHETSPLDSDLNDDSVFENSPEHLPEARASLPAIHRGRNKPRHRLSRKRRGYVAYSTRKDKNIRLTTVLETPLDDLDVVYDVDVENDVDVDYDDDDDTRPRLYNEGDDFSTI